MCFNVSMSNPDFSSHPDHDPATEQAVHDAAARRRAIEAQLSDTPDIEDVDSLTDEQRGLDPDLNEKAVQATLKSPEYIKAVARREIADARDKQDRSKENISSAANPPLASAPEPEDPDLDPERPF